MDLLFEILHRIRSLGLNPLAVVIAAGLLCAFLEQRLMRRRVPDFNRAYRNAPVYPNLPRRRRRKMGRRAA